MQYVAERVHRRRRVVRAPCVRAGCSLESLQHALSSLRCSPLAPAREQEAGYHPDVSNGLRRLGISEDGAEELVLEQSTFPQPGDTDAPPTRRYGVAMHSAQPVAAVSAQQSESEPSPESSAPVAVPIDLLLHRVFSAGHPGVGKMRAWLAEEEIYTAGDLQSALASSCTSGQVGAGAHYLRSLGFVAAWAEALAAAVQSNAVSERE